jgi:hypothetical protein
MGIVVPYSMSERRKREMRSKLFKMFRKQFLADGYPEDEANARALSKLRAIKLTMV